MVVWVVLSGEEEKLSAGTKTTLTRRQRRRRKKKKRKRRRAEKEAKDNEWDGMFSEAVLKERIFHWAFQEDLMVDRWIDRRLKFDFNTHLVRLIDQALLDANLFHDAYRPQSQFRILSPDEILDPDGEGRVRQAFEAFVRRDIFNVAFLRRLRYL